MSFRVHKIALGRPSESMQSVEIPLTSVILKFDFQEHTPTLWYSEREPYINSTHLFRYYLIGTGWEIAYERAFLNHIGTALQGSYVWHLFEAVN